MNIRIKRAYDRAEKTDGLRVLVDRLWPRGVSKEVLDVDLWLKEVAPEKQLRQWFAHDVSRWPEFRERYRGFLDQRGEELDRLLEEAAKNKVTTLIFAAKDEEHNNAVVLREWLEEKVQKSRGKGEAV